MNDFDKDCAEKKRIARGAHHKVSGRGKHCSLPSDHLTPAQLQAKCGPVNTWNLHQPMSWEAFKTAPPDIQKTYIDLIRDRFGANLCEIGRDLFGLSSSHMQICLTRRGLRFDTLRGKRLGREARAAWEAWLGREPDEPAEEVKPAETDGIQQSVAVEFGGEFDPDEILDLLKRLPTPAGRVRIRLEVSRA